MKKVTATEFAKNFGRHRERALRETLAVTNHGRIAGYFVSEEEYRALKAGKRTAWKVEDLPKEIIDQIANSKMHPRHNHLNKLLEDE